MHYNRKNKERKHGREEERSRSRERSKERTFQIDDRTKKFHVANLPLNITEEDLRQQFSSYGTIEEIKIIKKNNNGQFLKDFYYAFVTMSDQKSVQEVIKNYSIRSGNMQWIVSSSKEKSNDKNDYHRIHNNIHNPYNNNHGNNDFKHKFERRDGRDRKNNEEESENNNLEKDDSNLLSNLANLMKQKMSANNDKEEQKDYTTVLASILALPTDQLEKTMNNELSTQLSHINSQILVRELWIGNLPNDCTQTSLKKNLEIYGEIDNIDFFPKSPQNFAFVRFKKAEQATKAFENSRTITLLLQSTNLKMSYSDHQRRLNIVGDSFGCEKDEDLLPVVYIGYNTGVKIPPENTLREIFKQYSEVKGVLIKQAATNSGLRSYALVEFNNIEQVKQIIKKFMKEGTASDRRSKLGDKRCELFSLIKPKKPLTNLNTLNPNFHFDQNNINNNMGPNLFNNSIQNPPQKLQNQPNPNFLPNFFHPQNNYGPPPQLKNSLFESLQKNNLNHLNPEIPQNNPMIQKNRQPQLGMDQGMNKNFFPNFPPQIPQKPLMMNRPDLSQPNQNQILDIISQALTTENQETTQAEPETKDLEHYWSGFITRNKQHRVGVDATVVSGKEISMDEYNLNISHRTVYDEVLKKKHKSVVVFTPNNELHNKTFKDYINYFDEKKRAGVVTIKNCVLYLLPPGEEADKIYHIKDLQILGVFVDMNASNNDNNSDRIEEHVKKQNSNENKIIKQNDKNDIFNDEDVAGLLQNPDFISILKNIK